MQKLFAFTLLIVGVACCLPAFGDTVVAPEIDPTSGMNALAFIGGSLLILRSRCKK